MLLSRLRDDSLPELEPLSSSENIDSNNKAALTSTKQTNGSTSNKRQDEFCRRKLLMQSTRRYASMSNITSMVGSDRSNQMERPTLQFSIRRPHHRMITHNDTQQKVNTNDEGAFATHTSNNKFINPESNSCERFQKSLNNTSVNYLEGGWDQSESGHGSVESTNQQLANSNTNHSSSNNNSSSSYQQTTAPTPIQNRRSVLVRHSSISALNRSSHHNRTMQCWNQVVVESTVDQKPSTPPSNKKERRASLCIQSTSRRHLASVLVHNNHNNKNNNKEQEKKDMLQDLPTSIELTPRSNRSLRKAYSSKELLGRRTISPLSAASATCTPTTTTTATKRNSSIGLFSPDSSMSRNSSRYRHHSTYCGRMPQLATMQQHTKKKNMMSGESEHSFFGTPNRCASSSDGMIRLARPQATVSNNNQSRGSSCNRRCQLLSTTMTTTTTTTLRSMRGDNTSRVMTGSSTTTTARGTIAAKNRNSNTNHDSNPVTTTMMMTMDDSSHFVTGSRIRRGMSARHLFG